MLVLSWCLIFGQKSAHYGNKGPKTLPYFSVQMLFMKKHVTEVFKYFNNNYSKDSPHEIDSHF